MNAHSPSRESPHGLSGNPWIAVNLSAIWPGFGQVYYGAVLKGTGFVLMTPLLMGYIGWSLVSAEGNTLAGLMTVAILAVVHVINLLDAYNTVRPLPRGTFSTIYQPVRNRWYGLFLSQILPGFGHLYLRQTIAGALFLGLSTLVGYLANVHPILLPLPPMIWAIACYHLYRTTTHLTAEQTPSAVPSLGTRHSQRSLSSSTRQPLNPSRSSDTSTDTPTHWVLGAVIIGLLIIRLSIGYLPSWIGQTVLQCIVPSSSMEPTLQVGDRMFVRYPKAYQPQQGDLVVFRAPVRAIALLDDNPETLFVKRIIALPNQTVTIANGRVFVDQQQLPEPYPTTAPAYRLGPVTVPPRSYFVLGDNRNESADSHVWGFLPASDIIGRAYKIYWPPHRVQPLR